MKPPLIPRLVVLGLLLAAGLARGADAGEAYAAKLAGDYPRAISLYQALVEQEPANPAHYYQLGTVLGWAGRYNESISTLERGLQLAPDDSDLRLARARVLAWSGKLARAEELIRDILAGHPKNFEARNMLGRVLLWQRQFDAADEVFQSILTEKPADTDALIGSGDVQRFQERYDTARPYYERALVIDPASKDIQRRLASVRRAGRWRLDLGWGLSTFSGSSPLSDWEGWDAALRYALDRKTGLSLATVWAHRFDLDDQQFTLGLDRRITDNLSGYGRVSLTPAADFFARRSLAAGGEWRFRQGTKEWPPTVLLADYRVSRYGSGTAHSLALGVTQYTNHHLAVTVKGTLSRNLNGHFTTGWQVRLDGDPTDHWRWNLGYADGKESLSVTIIDYTREVRNRAVFAGVFREFSPTLGLRLDVSHEWTPGSPARNTLHAGLVTRF
ncbi:MAG TPA: YaiO family outer membrane beta-barrel protein [Lacunisphaera sp.]